MVGPAVRQYQATIIIPWQSSSVKVDWRVFLEILGLIEDDCQGLVPLIPPPTLLKHHLDSPASIDPRGIVLYNGNRAQ